MGVQVAEMDSNNFVNGKFTFKELSRGGTVVSRMIQPVLHGEGSPAGRLQSVLNAVSHNL